VHIPTFEAAFKKEVINQIKIIINITIIKIVIPGVDLQVGLDPMQVRIIIILEMVMGNKYKLRYEYIFPRF
jgi:hypothetical protein